MFDLIPFKNRKSREISNRGDVFEDFMSNFFNSFNSLSTDNFGSFKTDIKENENEYIVEAELPGIDKKDIDITLENDYLYITAENNEITEEKNDNYIRRERRSGRIQRSFYVKDINQDNIKANYENGILNLTLPKENPGLSKRKIEIK